MAGFIRTRILLVLLLFHIVLVLGKHLDICDRVPIHTTASRKPGDHGFSINVKGLSSDGKYTPGQTYQGRSSKLISKTLFLFPICPSRHMTS